jgi:hypothetical protein
VVVSQGVQIGWNSCFCDQGAYTFVIVILKSEILEFKEVVKECRRGKVAFSAQRARRRPRL